MSSLSDETLGYWTYDSKFTGSKSVSKREDYDLDVNNDNSKVRSKDKSSREISCTGKDVVYSNGDVHVLDSGGWEFSFLKSFSGLSTTARGLGFRFDLVYILWASVFLNIQFGSTIESSFLKTWTYHPQA